LYSTRKLALKPEMDWVRTLQTSLGLKTGGRRFLRRYGLASESEATESFAKMEP